MRGVILRARRGLSGLTMRTKLLLAFSIPVIAVMIAAMLVAHSVFTARSETEILSTMRGNFDLGYDRIVNFVDTMCGASDTIYFNSDLQRILSDPDYGAERTSSERYFEYMALNQVLDTAERTTDIYRASIFLRDTIPYTNNVLHFQPLSALFERSDYMRYIYTTRRNRYYFSPPVNLEVPTLDQTTRAVTLLRPVRSTLVSTKQIAIEMVAVEVSAIEHVLENTATTPGTFIYLSDEYRQLISSTDDARYYALKRNRVLPANTTDEDWQRTTVDGEEYYLLRRYEPTARWTMAALVPVSAITEQNNYVTVTIVIIMLVLLVVISLSSLMLADYFTRRLRNLNERIQTVRAGDIEAQPPAEESHDEISELFVSFSEMTGELKNLMLEQYRSGKAVKTAELRALQAQINPHFLYNTLDLINWEALDHDAPEISEIAQSLAKFYRISLNKGRQVVTIREELDHVRAYVDIENHHFDGNIHLTVDVPEDIEALGCINIILQPFVENAIMHGIAKDINRRECSIRIAARREGEDVLLTVSDDGPGMTKAQMRDIFTKNTVGRARGYGVKNIEARIRLSFGEGYGVSFESTEGKGTTVTVRLPALTPEEAEARINET